MLTNAAGGLDWHPGSDAYRDIATAQIILSGAYPADYQYLGEWLWFNPLTGAVIAAWSYLADLAPPQANVRMAPYINLAVPLCFFILVWCVAGGPAALLALVSLVFVLPQAAATVTAPAARPSRMSPRVSPMYQGAAPGC